jgi:hypothetical protein
MNRKQDSNDWSHKHGNKTDLDNIEEMDSDELSRLKSKTGLLNSDLMPESEFRNLKAHLEYSIGKPVMVDRRVKTTTTTTHGESRGIVQLFQAFHNVMIYRMKNPEKVNIPFVSHAIAQRSKEEQQLYQSQVFNNVTQLFMSPIAYKIKSKSYTMRLSPILQAKSEKSETDVKSSTARKARLQDHIVQSYFEEDHLTMLEVIYMVEIETNSLLKKALVSLQSDLVVFVFVWDMEPFLVFLLCFRLTSKAFTNSCRDSGRDGLVLNKNDSETQVLHVYRQDIISSDADQENEKDFFVHRRGGGGGGDGGEMSHEHKILFNGTKIHIDLLTKLDDSKVSFVHYGYAPQTTSYLL